MIVSFHPIFEGQKNIICAGRDPGPDDLRTVKNAAAVILPQGCRRSLYELAQNNCKHVFPNYSARFEYPGKLGQIRLFRRTGVAHPISEIYETVGSLISQCDETHEIVPFPFPFVFKFDWGGEGDTVFWIQSTSAFKDILVKAATFEKSGQKGFLIQEYIPNLNRSLRVVIIGQQFFTYWRIQNDVHVFHDNVSKGAIIDTDADPHLQQLGVELVKYFCEKTKINLAGFDVIFSTQCEEVTPMLLEINYFFGRSGLGGSQVYYEILQKEILNWLHRLDLPKP
ncbi:MAG: hypothetical protein PVI62_11110 [Desulfobacterales bacterium]|jgi:ribosomal protein S6--L-glutamate ligase